MAIKTKRGQIQLVVRFDVDGELIARVLAYASTRDENGSFSPPIWARTRTSAERGVVKELHKLGVEFFAKDGSWNLELTQEEKPRAIAAGKAVVARFFPELA